MDSVITPPAESNQPMHYHLRFQRELRASEQITTLLAPSLQHVHWLYEGWDDTNMARPLTGEMLRIYSEAACFMVRFCSTPDRTVAEERAKRWACMQMVTFLKKLVAATPDELEALVNEFAQSILDIHRHSLMHGAHVMTPHEKVLVMNLDDRAEVM